MSNLAFDTYNHEVLSKSLPETGGDGSGIFQGQGAGQLFKSHCPVELPPSGKKLSQGRGTILLAFNTASQSSFILLQNSLHGK